MQTILGSGGAIGKELAKALTHYTDQIRLVSRAPERVNDRDELQPADLLDPTAVEEAVEGSDVVYLTVGLEYKTKIWQEQWPLIMKNVINACMRQGAKMVFFDNIYMYDPNFLNGMTEDTPVNPISYKGKVRSKIVEQLLKRMAKQDLEALIARSADFYGPKIPQNSMLTELVFKPLSKGKTANWLGNGKYRHSFTFTPDAARATAMLGNTPEAFGQVWHLPTASHPPTGVQWVEQISKTLGAKPKMRNIPKWMVRFMGLFQPVMREIVEMFYQYDRDYVFDSSKFEGAFGMEPTPYHEGIRQIVKEEFATAE